MRILITSHQKGVAGSIYSIHYLAEGLIKKGHQVWVGGREASFLLQFPGASARKVRFPFKGYLDFQSMRDLAAFAKSENIQIINAQSGRDRFISILSKILYGTKAKLVFTRRQRPRDEPFLKRTLHSLYTEKIVVISTGLKKLFVKIGYSEKKLHVIFNGLPPGFDKRINLQKVEALKKKYKIKAGDVVMGCVSRLKEQHQIIKALKFLDPSIIVLFIGIERSQLEKVIEEEKPKQKLVFTSTREHDEVLHHYKLMDVNILASKMDGFGLVLVEAMAMGIPVIGSDFSGIADVIDDGRNGLLFENDNIADLSKKVLSILSDNHLKDLLIKEGLKTYTEKFTIQKTVDQYEALFQSLLDIKKPV